MKRRTEKIRIRVTDEELNYLKVCMAKDGGMKFKNGKENFSAYLRDRLLTNVGYRNKILEQQNKDLDYDLRKIGVNINQIARKINAGFGSRQDITNLFSYLNNIEQMLEDYQKKVSELWESPS